MDDRLALRRGDDRENDMIGVGVIAAVLVLLSLTTEEANIAAAGGGAAAGALLGLALPVFTRKSRSRPARPAVSPPVFTDEQVDAAVRALSDPERFTGAERRLAALAPQLQRILAGAERGRLVRRGAPSADPRRRWPSPTRPSGPPGSRPCWPRRPAWAC